MLHLRKPAAKAKRSRAAAGIEPGSDATQL
jgi:hypothetical protein